jgi:hypothetical protein
MKYLFSSLLIMFFYSAKAQKNALEFYKSYLQFEDNGLYLIKKRMKSIFMALSI